MFGGSHGIIGRRDRAIGPDQNRFAAGSPRIGNFHAVGLGHGGVRVTQQIVWKIKLFLERLVVAGGIDADPNDNRVLVIEVLDSITEPVAFDGSPRCVGFRIPPEQNILADVISQRDVVSVLVG